MVSIHRKILHKGEIIQEQLIQVLQKHEDYISNDTTSDSAMADVVGDSTKGLVKDVSDLKATVGDANTDNTLVKEVASLKTSKANSSHTHSLTNISDLTTVEAVVTYSDDSTETILLVKQVSSGG